MVIVWHWIGSGFLFFYFLFKLYLKKKWDSHFVAHIGKSVPRCHSIRNPPIWNNRICIISLLSVYIINCVLSVHLSRPLHFRLNFPATSIGFWDRWGGGALRPPKQRAGVGLGLAGRWLTRHRLGCFCTHYSLGGGGGSDHRAISKTYGRKETDEAAFERSRREASKPLSKI